MKVTVFIEGDGKTILNGVHNIYMEDGKVYFVAEEISLIVNEKNLISYEVIK